MARDSHAPSGAGRRSRTAGAPAAAIRALTALALVLFPLGLVALSEAPAPPPAAASPNLAWVSQPVPAVSEFGLASVQSVGGLISCPSASFCVTVNHNQGAPNSNCTLFQNGNTGNRCNQAYLSTFDGSAWTQVPTNGSYGFNTTSDGALNSVSCPAVNYCMAVGYTGDPPNPVILHYDGSSWHQQSVLSFAGEAGALLLGVTCPAVDDCIAVGGWLDNTGDLHMLAMTYDGTGWTMRPSGLGDLSTNQYLTSVACTDNTTNLCLATGRYWAQGSNNTQQYGSAFWYSGSTFGFTQDNGFPSTLPNATNGNPEGIQPTGEACLSASQCFVSGVIQNNNGGPTAFMEDDSSGTWTEDTNVSNTAPAQFSALGNVTCVGSSWCISTGLSIAFVGNSQGAMSSMSYAWTPGGGWAPLSTASSTGNPDETAVLSVSCLAVDQCEGSGFYNPSGEFSVGNNFPSNWSIWAGLLTQPNATLTTTVSNDEAGAQNVQYSFTFTTWQLGTVGSLSFTVPTGTLMTQPLANPSVVEVFGVGPGTASLSFGAITYTLNTPQVIPAGVPIELVFGGIHNTTGQTSFYPVADSYDTAPTPNVIDTAISSDPLDIGGPLTGATVAVPDALTFVNENPSINLLPIPNGPQVSQDDNLEVTTNAGQGYTLTAIASPIALPSPATATIAEAPTSGTDNLADEFGANVNYQGNPGLNGPLNTANYFGYPIEGSASPMLVMSRSGPTGNDPDVVNMIDSIQIDSSQATGTYTGTITYSATPSY